MPKLTFKEWMYIIPIFILAALWTLMVIVLLFGKHFS